MRTGSMCGWYVRRYNRSKILSDMEQEIDRLIQIWTGPFADNYSDRPRLCNMIRDAQLDFIKSGIEEDGGMLYIIMYVFNQVQRLELFLKGTPLFLLVWSWCYIVRTARRHACLQTRLRIQYT